MGCSSCKAKGASLLPRISGGRSGCRGSTDGSSGPDVASLYEARQAKLLELWQDHESRAQMRRNEIQAEAQALLLKYRDEAVDLLGLPAPGTATSESSAMRGMPQQSVMFKTARFAASAVEATQSSARAAVWAACDAAWSQAVKHDSLELPPKPPNFDEIIARGLVASQFGKKKAVADQAVILDGSGLTGGRPTSSLFGWLFASGGLLALCSAEGAKTACKEDDTEFTTLQALQSKEGFMGG